MSPISYADKMSPIKWAEQAAKNKAEEQAKEQEKAKEKESSASLPASVFSVEEEIAGALPPATIREPQPAKTKPAARKAK